jgi:hypothetical protein
MRGAWHQIAQVVGGDETHLSVRHPPKFWLQNYSLVSSAA